MKSIDQIKRLISRAIRSTTGDPEIREVLYHLREHALADAMAGDAKKIAVILRAVDDLPAKARNVKARVALRLLVGKYWPERRQSPRFILNYRGRVAAV